MPVKRASVSKGDKHLQRGQSQICIGTVLQKQDYFSVVILGKLTGSLVRVVFKFDMHTSQAGSCSLLAPQ